MRRPQGRKLVLVLLSLCSFAANVGGRYFDPLITAIARDFGVTAGTAALLSSAFALPFGLGQLLLGPLGDRFGKPRVFTACFWLLALSFLASAFVDTLPLLFASRIVAGFAAGGVIPLGLAMLGDAFAPAERQVAFARYSSATVLGALLGLPVAGALAEAVGWQQALLVPAAIAVLAAAGASLRLKPSAAGGAAKASTAQAGYGAVLRNPAALVCFATAFWEGLFIYGPLPFVVYLLERQGIGGPREAGLAVAAMSLGFIMVAAFVRPLLGLFGWWNMMRVGGALAALALAALPFSPVWWLHGVLLGVLGIGFFMIHNSLQGRIMEVAPDARGSATALHYFSYFMGQAAGPFLFGLLLGSVDAAPSFLVNAAGIAATGLLAAGLLRGRLARARRVV
jgi:predicted MFS family arabinose efflux permease